MRQLRWGIGLWIALGIMTLWLGLPSTPVIATDGLYTYRRWHHADGIGKFYQGREIAQVMGHRGLGWLERPSRPTEEAPDRAIAALTLPPDAWVADIGAGSGYFTFAIAPRIPAGQLFAVDVQPEMVALLQARREALGADNVQVIQGTERDPHLPAHRLDLVLLVDTYHEFAYPYEMMSAIAQALKPGGQVVLLEYRQEDPRVLIKSLHKMSERQVRQEMALVGLSWVQTGDFLPQQHFLVFEKPA